MKDCTEDPRSVFDEMLYQQIERLEYTEAKSALMKFQMLKWEDQLKMVEDNQSQTKELLRQLQEKSNGFQNQTGTYVWKISDWSKKVTDAKSGEKIKIISPPMYSSPYGYKFETYVYPNGNDDATNTHLSVYIKIQPGEYDGILSWPFRHRVTFTLLGPTTEKEPQNYSKIKTHSFIPDIENPDLLECFQRPKETSNKGYGEPKFITHEEINKDQFVIDDNLYLKVEITLLDYD